mmetsp:Transcript_11057/g.24351  ORF Transcript_11057/g.24351 Transcript_11057/m.24351 type:complete len:896 (+) Transcript_11057:147-2834(+)
MSMYDMQQYAAAMQQQQQAYLQAYSAAGYDISAYQAALQQQQQQMLAQQQQQQQAQQQQQQGAGGGGNVLQVTGCANETVGNIVRGVYNLSSQNHERPVYCRTEQVNNMDVLIYFWDERDGPSFCGWWFGPKVGGDQVWAYNPSRAGTPPPSGWQVPYDGPIDHSFAVTPQGASAEGYEAAIKRQEEERIRQEQQRALEEQQRKQEEARLRIEQHAATTARTALRELMNVTPENATTLWQQVQTVLQTELPKCGSMAGQIQQEAQQAMEQAQQQVEAVKAQRIRDAERKAEETQILEQTKSQNQVQMGEFAVLVEKTEAAGAKLKEIAAPLDKPGGMSVPDSEALLKMVASTATECISVAQEALAFALQRRQLLEPTSVLSMQFMSAEAKQLVDEVRPELLKLEKRLSECLQLAVTTHLAAKTNVVKAGKREKATRTMEARTALFKKYDANGDGFLDASEIAVYAKGEYKYELSSAQIDRILAAASSGTAGKVDKEHFAEIKLVLGVIREEAAAAERIRIAEEKRKVLEEKKAGYVAQISKLAESITAFEASVAKVIESIPPLQQTDFASVTPSDFKGKVSAVEENIEGSKKESETLRASLKDITVSATEPELTPFVQLECRKLELKVEMLIPRLGQIQMVLENVKMNYARVQRRELDILRSKVARALKARAAAEKWSKEELLKSLDKDEDGSVSASDFTAACQACTDLEITTESAEQLFKHLDYDSEGKLSAETLETLTKTYYRVAAESILTAELSVAEAGGIRRLEISELLEELEPPATDEASGLKRVKAIALRDGSTGWVTIAGNETAIFLEETLPFVTLVAPWQLTKEVGAMSELAKDLPAGEVVEILDYTAKEENGQSRIRVRTTTTPSVIGYLPGPVCDPASLLRYMMR